MADTIPSQENRQFRLDRIMEVLELAGSTDEGIPLSDVVAGLGIPSSTAYRLLGDMRRVGMLDAPNGRGRHRLSARLEEIVRAKDVNRVLFGRIETLFKRLADEVGETVYLVRMRGRVISLVGFVKPFGREGLHPGNAFPIHASAAGKALWANRPEDEVAAEIARPHVKFRDKTLIAEDEIRAELMRVRSLGFGVHDEEWDEGVYTMAIAFPDATSALPNLALGVIAEKARLFTRFTEEELFERLKCLRDEAQCMLASR